MLAPPKIVRIVVADDHGVLRDILCDRLSDEPDFQILQACSNGQEVMDIVRQEEADLILMDIEMDVMDGITATRQLKTEFPQIAVLALTAIDRDSAVAEMMQAGVDGYCLKTLEVDDLIRAIRLVSQGIMYISPEIVGRMRQIVSSQSTATDLSSEMVKLTQRELEILQSIARGFSNGEIAESLSISINTVRSHVKNILSKFGVSNRVEAVLKARKLHLLD
ncbi:response regulator transcription factor [Synechococcus sp. PCC 7336]|uniref:response regulator n=1 Tax=Synechococcus sp. PCC 7336 TaxID=195250 RepID=UPI0003481388|nr:response regulator transcription factor [Synechococcus sp. PCC 7336]